MPRVDFSDPYSGNTGTAYLLESTFVNLTSGGDFLVPFSNTTDFVEITSSVSDTVQISSRATWPLGDFYIANNIQPDFVLDFSKEVYRTEKVT